MKPEGKDLLILKKISRFKSKIQDLEKENKKLEKELLVLRREKRENGKISIRK